MNKSYVPLYRKYRPQTIDQIVGQEHIKRALTNAIQMDRISHAYLFTGPRGTGKTSTARIFAKSLNCEKGPTISPCNECENCKNITNSIPIDVIEIDAASNRSVNDADDIIQKVALAPVQSRYKIYIIDEVHMLTNQAFNALLKTLEEPPKNVIFILATTEVHKVLDTIKSRCQRFDFKRITTSDIAKHLRYISDQESINITDDALAYIAQNSAGGMRDSIALLDQLSVLNSTDSPISVDDINRLLGRLSFDSLTALFESIAKSNQNEALNVLNSIYNQGNEPAQILSNFLEYLRNSLIIKSVAGASVSGVVQLNEEQIKIVADKVSAIENHQIVSLIDKCAYYIKELKLTANPKLWLDVAVLDMANLTENTKLEDLQKRLISLESGNASRLINVSSYNTPPAPVMKQEVKNLPHPSVKPGDTSIRLSASEAKSSKKEILSEDEILNQPVPNSKPASQNELKALWVKLLENISSFPSRAILKQQALPVKITPEEVIISIKNQSWLKQFGPDGAKHSFIVEAVSDLFQDKSPKIVVRAPAPGDDAIRSQKNKVNGEEDEASTPAAPFQNVSKNELETPVINNTHEIRPVQKTNSETKTDSKIETQNPYDKSQVEPDENQKDNHNHPSHNSENSYHSDNVNMVIDLFEGKLIE